MSIEANYVMTKVDCLSNTLSVDEYNKILQDNRQIINQKIGECVEIFKSYNNPFYIRDLKKESIVCKQLNETLCQVMMTAEKIQEIAISIGNTKLIEDAQKHSEYLKIAAKISTGQSALVLSTSISRVGLLTFLSSSVFIYGLTLLDQSKIPSLLRYPLVALGYGALATSLGSLCCCTICSEPVSLPLHAELMGHYQSIDVANHFWQ